MRVLNICMYIRDMSFSLAVFVFRIFLFSRSQVTYEQQDLGHQCIQQYVFDVVLYSLTSKKVHLY